MKTIPYKTKKQQIDIHPDLSLNITTLLNQQQFFDPNDQAARLGICSAAWPLFGMLWPSSIQLALKLIKRPIDKNSTLLEIGCGLGIASMTAKILGYDITASDRHPLAGKFLQKNSLQNEIPPIRFKHSQWGDVPTPALTDTNAPLLKSQYDHIIASDILYEPDAALDVAHFIDRFGAKTCTVWIIDPNRGYHNHFKRAMTQYGFHLTEMLAITTPINNEPYRGRLMVYDRTES